jgi:hypothetical protein
VLRDQARGIESHARLRLIELAASELLESETNGSMVLGVRGAGVEPLVVTAAGCSILVTVGQRSPVLMPVAALHRRGGGGPRAIAAGCDRALRAINRLPDDFALTVSFDVAANATRFIARLA